MTSKDFMDYLYADKQSHDSQELQDFFTSNIEEMPFEDRAVAAAAIVRFLAMRDWHASVEIAPFAIMMAGDSQPDKLEILDSLEVYRPKNESLPEAFAREIDSAACESPQQAAAIAQYCYRVHCLQLLRHVRAAAPDSVIIEKLKTVESASMWLHPVNDTIIHAISAMSDRISLLEPHREFLQRIIAAARTTSKSQSAKLPVIVKVFQSWDSSNWVNSEW